MLGDPEPEAWARLGRALRQDRQQRGFTQRKLAALANVSVPALADAEGGRVPKSRMPYSLAKIAAALGWPAGSVEEVLGGAPPPRDWTVGLAPSMVEKVLTQAIVQATSAVTAAEIRTAVAIALHEFRDAGMLAESGQIGYDGVPVDPDSEPPD